MPYKINISLEKKESGYSASCPEITDRQFEGDSLDIIFAELKKAIQLELQTLEKKASQKVDKPIWEVAQSLIQDITEDEINLLPTNGAEQHDYYIYE
ncbi:MAG: hypothetical protein F6K40_01980 [Okeania sp. SIO3I5]|uniref:hypothetical protein n=1 Tax=Okeania sp. SIO3I5 TaxID=2607805 RepID=UPI0013B6046F|nr:hypothetical protein [Okeania sp. SIO3I5]NEQ35142.1 hypothetical protein [Okeania sp. SIO3I5]